MRSAIDFNLGMGVIKKFPIPARPCKILTGIIQILKDPLR